MLFRSTLARGYRGRLVARPLRPIGARLVARGALMMSSASPCAVSIAAALIPLGHGARRCVAQGRASPMAGARALDRGKSNLRSAAHKPPSRLVRGKRSACPSVGVCDQEAPGDSHRCGGRRAATITPHGSAASTTLDHDQVGSTLPSQWFFLG